MSKAFWVRVRKRWRAWLRSIHRDVGYLAVGLTFVYALSGIAINHVGEIDPNFREVEETVTLTVPLPEDSEAVAALAVQELGVFEPIRDVYEDEGMPVEVALDRGTIEISRNSGRVVYRHEQPRFFFRVANWLHYNRGKKAWTYVADGYAFFLLFLATSGAFMLKGRKGLFGRGAALILVGVAVPILYVIWSKGP